MKLVIVESPTKAKTISKFLGKEYSVKSSYGHIRDLPAKKMGIDIENDFAPEYVIPAKSAERVEELKELAQKSQEVILATDEDREGEAIAWHLSQILGLSAGNPKSQIQNTEYKRIVFHEITKQAIEKALENPRDIDLNLVDAQQARRILDRLVGFELSPFLWKKIRRGLSAGRVQSVALRLIVEREREIEKFKSEEYFAITAKLKTGGRQEIFDSNLVEMDGKKVEQTLTLKLFAGDYKIKKTVIDSRKKANEIIDDLQRAEFKVKNITEKETLRHPSPPFTTSSLQQAAIGNLGFSAKFTMSVAQKLYEKGYITYMRTDSLNLSLASMLSAQKTVARLFGKNYALPDPKFYKTKSKGAQEAHEAIRPAYPDKTPDDLKAKIDPSEHRLYSLIWKRMLASQMQPAIFDSVKLEVDVYPVKPPQSGVREAKFNGASNYLLQANGSTVKFDGYLKIYGGKANGENLLPKMKIGENLELIEALAAQKETAAPPRYNEATLVKVMEENGIGRPSTYAPTISTIIERKYVDKNEEKRLYPLEIGALVNDLLVAHFPEIVDIKFTATIEMDFDEIAEGKRKWVPVIREFYKPFQKNLAAKAKEVKKEDFQEKLDRACPDCGGDLIIKFGRFGKFIACSNYPNCKHTEKTDAEKKADEEHKGEVCEVCGAPMAVKRGKFGTFLGCSNYPQCKGIKKIEKKTGIKCPKCNVGDIVERKSKRGRPFYGCNTYPKCDFALWNKPNGEICPQCKSLLVFAAKGKIKCSNKECEFKK